MGEWLGSLWLDTAAVGADCGVPCSTEEMVKANRLEVLGMRGCRRRRGRRLGEMCWCCFPGLGTGLRTSDLLPPM